jgi:hypothetical protein
MLETSCVITVFNLEDNCLCSRAVQYITIEYWLAESTVVGVSLFLHQDCSRLCPPLKPTKDYVSACG